MERNTTPDAAAAVQEESAIQITNFCDPELGDEESSLSTALTAHTISCNSSNSRPPTPVPMAAAAATGSSTTVTASPEPYSLWSSTSTAACASSPMMSDLLRALQQNQETLERGETQQPNSSNGTSQQLGDVHASALQQPQLSSWGAMIKINEPSSSVTVVVDDDRGDSNSETEYHSGAELGMDGRDDSTDVPQPDYRLLLPSATTSRARVPLQQHHQADNGIGVSTINEEGRDQGNTCVDAKTTPATTTIRASLDSGMAIMGRWIRSRKTHSTRKTDSPTEMDDENSSDCDRNYDAFAQRGGDTHHSLRSFRYDSTAAENRRRRSLSEPEMRDFDDTTAIQRQGTSTSSTCSNSGRSALRQRRACATTHQRARRRALTMEGSAVDPWPDSTPTRQDVGNRSSARIGSSSPQLPMTPNSHRCPNPSTPASAALLHTTMPLHESSTPGIPIQNPFDLLSPMTAVVATSDAASSINNSGGSGIGGSTRSRRFASNNSTNSLETNPYNTAGPLTAQHGPTTTVVSDGVVASNSGGNSNRGTSAAVPDMDRERISRIRWIRINRRFQLVITFVALLFSLLLFAILICWVVLTSAYVLSFDKSCDVALKPYYWLVTLQLLLDVFRTEIMRFAFGWDARSNQRIPFRVIAYNIGYLIYALMVLRLGIHSSYAYDERPRCQETAPDLFNASVAFVTLSISAWVTIICGYLLPFCVVAALLTLNGYNPSAATHVAEGGSTQPVFPAAYATSGAPPGCIDQLPVLPLHSFPETYPRECCICMEEFNRQDVIVETKCKHVFHKSCSREWLRQARSCPVCRDDIPTTIADLSTNNGTFRANSHVRDDITSPDNNSDYRSDNNNNSSNEPVSIPIGPSGRPVVGLLMTLRRAASTLSEASSMVSRNNSTATLTNSRDSEGGVEAMEEGGRAASAHL